MDAKILQKLKEHYESWSGGWPPEDDRDVFIYVEYARLSEWDADDVRTELRNWMG